MIPRILTKRVFCYIFSIDGQIPIQGKTLFTKYIEPHLAEFELTEAEWKGYRRGIPTWLSRRIMEKHEILEEEVAEALVMVRKEREEQREMRRVERKAILMNQFRD